MSEKTDEVEAAIIDVVYKSCRRHRKNSSVEYLYTMHVVTRTLVALEEQGIPIPDIYKNLAEEYEKEFGPQNTQMNDVLSYLEDEQFSEA